MSIGSLYNNFFEYLKTKMISILVDYYLFCDIVYLFTTLNPFHNTHLNKYPTILLVYALFYVSLMKSYQRSLDTCTTTNPCDLLPFLFPKIVCVFFSYFWVFLRRPKHVGTNSVIFNDVCA
jgi:hypothetical protein